MQLDRSLEKKWNLCENCFDMAAFCFDFIRAHIGALSEAVFISQYMDRGSSPEQENPNLKRLRRLMNEVKGVLYQEPIPGKQAGLIWKAVRRHTAGLLDFGEEDENLATIFMAVLQGIDLHVCGRHADRVSYSLNGPLNHADRADTLVYLKSRESLLDVMKTGYKFRTRVDCGGIRDALDALLMIKKSDLNPMCEYPQIKPLSIHGGREKLKRRLARTKILKIAVIPERIPKGFVFDQESTPGSTFRVKYASEQEEEIQAHCRWMETAVRKGANLIVFPEFFTSMDILEGMKSWLKEQRREDWMRESSLIAVCAGTTWHESDNNVMHLLDWEGEEIGTYYKYSPFTQLPPDVDDSDTYKMCERLTEPGKKSTLLDIEIIGRVLPAICRDVIDGKFTEYLVREFAPFLLLTSAYSQSVTSFKRHYSSYASRYYVTSVLCNACDAAKGEKLDLCTVPMKDKSEMCDYTEEIVKCCEMPEKCPESCCIFLELDYKVRKAADVEKRPNIWYKRYRNVGKNQAVAVAESSGK